MLSKTRVFALILSTSALSGCGLFGGGDGGELRTAADLPPQRADGNPADPVRTAGEVQDFPVILGEPYTIGNTVFAPFDKMSFDEVGYAAVISPEKEGRPTVNNERMSASSFSAAHRTLPVPSYVEVTSVENGRTVLVRINDRGPMLDDRVIALSMAAAQQLGLNGDGTSGVRVRRVNPPEQERAVLRAGGKAAGRLETPPGLRAALKAKLPPLPAPLAGGVPVVDAIAPATATDQRAVQTIAVPPASLPAPSAPIAAPPQQDRFIIEQAGAPRSSAPPRKGAGTTYAPPLLEADKPSKGGYAIQIGAFADPNRAAAAAQATGAQVFHEGNLYRVRTIPYETAAAARAALPAIQAKGYAEARVVVNGGK
jgi:rare lipoprotein A